MIKLNNIKLSLDESLKILKSKEKNNSFEIFDLVSNILNIDVSKIRNVSIAKESIDARGNVPFFVLSLDIKLVEKSLENKFSKNKKFEKYNINVFNDNDEIAFLNKQIKLEHKKRPIIVGFGPAGMFASIVLVKNGLYPIILERGKKIDERVSDVRNFIYNKILNENSNVQFGEGGAGAFSDGKLSTGVKSKYNRFILKTFVEMGAPEEILYKAQPHIGTDKLRVVVENIRNYVESLGGSFLFNTSLENIITKNNSVVETITYNHLTNTQNSILSDNIILCIGHSARDTIEMLYKIGVNMEQKPFAIGLRIEHKQEDLNRSRYNNFSNHPALPPATYNINVRTPDKRGVYSFCMCPGGEVVIASSEKEKLVVNGMSYHSRSNINANSALLVGINPSDFESNNVLSSIDFQRNIEEKAFNIVDRKYVAPCQRVEDFLNNTISENFSTVIPSCKSGYKPVNLNKILPEYITRNLKYALPLFGNQIKCFSDYNAVLTGVETRSSSPVKILRDENGCTNIKGLYGAGEGSGYAGGIMSAAIDGIKIALNMIEKIKEKS